MLAEVTEVDLLCWWRWTCYAGGGGRGGPAVLAEVTAAAELISVLYSSSLSKKYAQRFFNCRHLHKNSMLEQRTSSFFF